MPSPKKKTTKNDSKAVKVRLTEPELHYVEWLDAVVDNGWSDENDHRSHLCVSVGFLIKETDKEIVLAADISSDTMPSGTYDTNRRIAIPLSWIQVRKKVRIDGRQTGIRPSAKKRNPS